jgi:hypothetical protein
MRAWWWPSRAELHGYAKAARARKLGAGERLPVEAVGGRGGGGRGSGGGWIVPAVDVVLSVRDFHAEGNATGHLPPAPAPPGSGVGLTPSSSAPSSLAPSGRGRAGSVASIGHRRRWLYHSKVLTAQSPWVKVLPDISPMSFFWVPPVHSGALETKNGPISHLWYGMAGSRTRPHFDLYENYFVQVVGRKRWLLAPPGQFSEMYVLPSSHPSGRQSALDWPHLETSTFPLASKEGALRFHHHWNRS